MAVTTMGTMPVSNVSLESASICAVDATGRIMREAKVASEPEILIEWLRALGFAVARIGAVHLLPDISRDRGIKGRLGVRQLVFRGVRGAREKDDADRI